MHESDKDPVLEELRKQTEVLERIYDAQMSTFVQVTRLYDVFVASATGGDDEYLERLLEDHRNGVIHTAPPVVKTFGEGYVDED